jgi:filamentous hemagglutinin family protein
MTRFSPTLLASAQIVSIGVLGIGVFSTPAISQITPDTTLGAEGSTVIPGTLNGLSIEQIDGGAIRGQNLFHSFQDFNISEGASAYFSNPANISNIFSRITGTNPSNIQGTLGVLGTANLFFLNPNGILFGPNARLDVKGSFLATTANGVQFGDQGFFNATNPEAPPVLTVNPSALLFNQIQAQGITSQASLSVPESQSLLLAGGPVTQEGGQLLAPNGQVEIGSVNGSGTIDLLGSGNTWSLQFPADLARGDISLTGATVDVSGERGGSIAVQGGNVLLNDSLLQSNTIGTNGGDISVDAQGQAVLANQSLINTATSGSGNAGNLFVAADTLLITDGSQLTTTTSGAGEGGNLTFTIDRDLRLSGFSNTLPSLIGSSTQNSGQGGDISIDTINLVVENNAAVLTQVLGSGRGGNLNVQASGSVSLSGNNRPFQTGLFAKTEGSGSGGNINLASENLFLEEAAQIYTETSTAGGTRGDISIVTSDLVSLSGKSSIEALSAKDGGSSSDIIVATGMLTLADQAFISALSEANNTTGGNILITAPNSVHLMDKSEISTGSVSSASDSGDISITTGNLLLQDEAGVLAITSLGNRAGGDITITAKDSVVLLGDSGLITGSILRGGEAGDVAIDTSKLDMQGTSRINTLTAVGGKDGGNITINATDSISLKGSSSLTARSLLNGGDAGTINLTTGTLKIQDQANLNALTFQSNGNGGDITINALEQVNLTDDSEIVTSSASDGNAGNITIDTEQMTLQGESAIRASTFGRGKGGNIIIDASSSILVSGETSGLFTTSLQGSRGDAGMLSITTGDLTLQNQATLTTQTEGSGNAGDIELNVDRLTVTGGATVITSTAGAGAGGNLIVTATDFVDLSGSGIADRNTLQPSRLLSRSQGSGDAGNVDITTNQFIAQNGGQVSASSDSIGNAGNVKITAATIELSGTATTPLRFGAEALESGVFAQSLSIEDGGNAGTITLNTGQLVLKEGAQILTSTVNDGQAGKLSITATDSVVVSGFDLDNQSQSLMPSKIASQTTGSGNAGMITIDTQQLLVQNGGEISAASLNSSDAVATGQGGSVQIVANTVDLKGGGKLATSTEGTGDAGTIDVTAAERITIADTGSAILTSTGENSTGNGNTITLNTSELNIKNGAEISTQSAGKGQAGDIQVQAETIELTQGNLIASAAQAGGGDIQIAAREIDLTQNSLISTSVADSTGGGGNMSIVTRNFAALENSDILAIADEGPGGNISIKAQSFVADLYSNNGPTPSNVSDFNELRRNDRVDISASSRLGVSGIVTSSELENVESLLALLGIEFVSPDKIVAGSCLAQQNLATGRFTVTGTGGLAPTPYDAMQLEYATKTIPSIERPSNQAFVAPSLPSPVKAWKPGDPVQEASQIAQTNDGRLLLAADSANLHPAENLICR